MGPLALPFPGNFLFLKYVPPIKRWGPYRELSAPEWEGVLVALEAAGARMTAAITAGWVEANGSVTPFPRKFPDAAGVIREGARRGLLEIANHGYTHCVLRDRRFRPRLFVGNRQFHREFHDWLPPGTHREHVERAQSILQEFFGQSVVTFVPPGNVFSRVTLHAAAAGGIRYVSCLDPGRFGPVDGLTWVADGDVVALHDRDLVLGGLAALERVLRAPAHTLVTVREVGARLDRGAR
jgi:peptidoglycan/xylan/chitin deacetylase (PgdA/CDA1 family)